LLCLQFRFPFDIFLLYYSLDMVLPLLSVRSDTFLLLDCHSLSLTNNLCGNGYLSALIHLNFCVASHCFYQGIYCSKCVNRLRIVNTSIKYLLKEAFGNNFINSCSANFIILQVLLSLQDLYITFNNRLVKVVLATK
jgi:hypothetical protein